MNSENASSPHVDLRTLVESAQVLGRAISESQMFGCQNVGQGIVIAFHCLQTQQPLLQYQAEYHLILGKPSMKPEAMLARFIRDGGSYEWAGDGTDGVATLIVTPKGEGVSEVSYSIEDAKRARLIKADKPDSGWMKNPAEMLRARVVSRAMRMHAPHLVVGVYTPEEIQDFTAEPSPAIDAADHSQSPDSAAANTETDPTRPRRGRPPKSAPSTTVATASPPVASTTPVLSDAVQAPAVSQMTTAETAGATTGISATDATAAASPTTGEPAGIDTLQLKRDRIKAMAEDVALSAEAWSKIFTSAGVDSIEAFSAEQLEKVETLLRKKAMKMAKASDEKSLETWANSFNQK